ncbi:hypothetical protein D8M34_18050, partial [Microbacterium sp. HSID17254]|uniref:hypothetical protein n=1 Tax=Microbacterium sp. HSID17254 TaxID=2419509 RepID=UPI000F96FEFD
MLVFGRSSMEGWVAGSRTATVISVRPDVVVGGVVTVASPGGIARLPMRVVQCLPLDELGVLPLVAERAGVELSQFTVCRSWEAYVKTLSEQRVVSFPARVLVLEVAGELIGKIPPKKRPEPKRKRQPPAPPKLKPAPTTPKKQAPKKKQPSPQREKKVKATWVQVGFARAPSTPQPVVHPRGLAAWGQRSAAVMARREPGAAGRRALPPVGVAAAVVGAGGVEPEVAGRGAGPGRAGAGVSALDRIVPLGYCTVDDGCHDPQVAAAAARVVLGCARGPEDARMLIGILGIEAGVAVLVDRGEGGGRGQGRVGAVRI